MDEEITRSSVSDKSVHTDDSSNKSYYQSYSSEMANSKIPKTPDFVPFSPQDYFEKRINIGKYKLPELKQLAKYHKLRVSGNKIDIIRRIEGYFREYKNSIIIQKAFRGHLVRYSFSLRGEAFKTRKCVNSSDFYSMEPLEEIEFERFFSYRDKQSFVYGFDLFSLLHLYKTSGKMTNPYNRENIDISIVRKLFSLCKIMKIVFPHITKPELDILNTSALSPTRIVQRTTHRVRDQTPAPPTATIEPAVHIHRPAYLTPAATPQTNVALSVTTQSAEPVSISRRIREVFMEIDNLGNYTDVSWFLLLSRNAYVSFYNVYYNLWRYILSPEIKYSICPNVNPFRNSRAIVQETSIDNCREICLQLIENMVYNGINMEYRKLGALHVLTALTCVSPQAREAIPWLADVVAY